MSACTTRNFAVLSTRRTWFCRTGAAWFWGQSCSKHPLKQKVAGIDFADQLAGRLARTGKTLYLLGSKPGVAEQAAANLQTKYPGLQIVGTADGYFQDEAQVVETINAARPDVLFVCLGAPKQELIYGTSQKQLQVGLMIGLGGSLDGFAGTVKRAPVWMQRAGLEWLYRLIKEPRRFKRMLRLPKFVLAVLFHKKKR